MVVGSPTKLNLIPSGVMPVVYINQGDAGYDKEFLIYNGDSPYNVPAGVSATIRGKKADGYGVTEAATLTTGSNLVTVTITEQMVAAEGANLYELVFVDTDGLRIATINMVWAVKADALGDAVISESDLDYATTVMNTLQSVQAFKNQLDANTNGLEDETAARIAADNALNTKIDAESVTRGSQDNLLQSQINQLVAPTGTAPSAAEIENARIGENGITYTTLGEAIRDQFSNVMQPTRNLFDFADTSGTASDIAYSIADNNFSASGTATTVVSIALYFKKTIILPVGSYTISIHGANNTDVATYFYIHYSDGYSNAYTMNPGVNHVTFNSTNTNPVDRIMIRYSNNPAHVSVTGYLQLEAGTIATDYVPPYTANDAVLKQKVEELEEANQRDMLVPPFFLGGIDEANGTIYVGNNYNALLTFVRTNIIYLKAGSYIENPSTTSLVMWVVKYNSFSLNDYVSYQRELGTGWRYTVAEDGYYALSIRRQDYAQINDASAISDLLSYKFYGKINDVLDITFFDNEETSDGIFIVFPDGKNLLVDGGYDRNYTNLRRIVSNKGFRHIDNLIISHYHTDHAGAIVYCLQQGYLTITGTIYLPDQAATQWAYDNNIMEADTKQLYTAAMTAFNNSGATIVYPSREYQNFRIGEATVSFFNTDMSVYEGVSTNYNDWSLCNYVFFGQMNLCLTGDIGPIAEGNLAGKLYKANVYKAEHHGWANWTEIPNNYIDYASPDVIFSCDGLSHDELLLTDKAPLVAWAEEFCVPYYRTHQNGNINVLMSKESWKIATKAKRYVRSHNPVNS